RGVELGDFIFDAAIQEVDRRIALEVLSFGSPRKDWTPVLHDAGHFLYGIREVHAPGLAVVQPPIDDSDKKASRFFERVEKWFAKEGVPTLSPEEVSDAQISVCLSEPAAALKPVATRVNDFILTWVRRFSVPAPGPISAERE